jgi:hypothetical protein
MGGFRLPSKKDVNRVVRERAPDPEPVGTDAAVPFSRVVPPPLATLAAFGHYAEDAAERDDARTGGVLGNGVGFHGRVTPAPAATILDVHADRHGVRGSFTGENSGSGMRFDSAEEKREIDEYGIRVNNMPFTPEPFATRIDLHANRDGARGGVTGERSGRGLTFDTGDARSRVADGIDIEGGFTPEPFATRIDLHANRDGVRGGVTGERSGRGATFDSADAKRRAAEARRRAADAKRAADEGVSVENATFTPWPFTSEIDLYANRRGAGGSVRVTDEMNTRGRARDAANDARDAAHDAASDAGDAAHDAASDAGDAAHDAADAAQDAANDAADEGADAGRDAAGAAHDAASDAGNTGSNVVNEVSSWRP